MDNYRTPDPVRYKAITIERWLRKVRVPQSFFDCWIWVGAGDRYGVSSIRSAPREPSRVLGAHVLGYMLAFGDLDDNVQVHHRCENRRCVNPMHLRGLTRKEHAAEHPEIAPLIERQQRSVCLKGHSMDDAILQADGKRRCRACNREWGRKRSTFNRGDHKTECKHGHPWIDENIRVKGNGHRECLVCAREQGRVRERARQARLREERNS